MIGGVELNPGPEDNAVQVLCSGCDRNLKSGTQCESCGQWYHNSCGNVKLQVAESGKWNCDRCRSERLRVLEEKLKDAQNQIEELQRKNKALEDQLLQTENGKNIENGDTVAKPVGVKCLVLGDSIVRNVGAGKSDMRVECFPGIRADQLRRVMENRDLGHSDAVVIHVGTNDIRRTKNLDYLMGEVHDLISTAKAKFPGSRLVLSGVLRRKGVNWRRVGATNDRLEWVAGALGATFVDPNSWIRDEDFRRDGLHLNIHGARQLGDLYSRVCGLDN
jgi:lysophospholipase L1-like esterase